MANPRPRARDNLARRDARSFKEASMLVLASLQRCQRNSVAGFGWQLFETPGAAFCSQRLHKLSVGHDSVNDCVDAVAIHTRSLCPLGFRTGSALVEHKISASCPKTRHLRLKSRMSHRRCDAKTAQIA